MTDQTGDLQAWRERWQRGTTRWDLGGPHRLTATLLARATHCLGVFPAGQLYMPGAGRAHDAMVFVEQGWHVVVADIVPEAVTEAQRLYAAHSQISFRVEDALLPPAADEVRYDACFDRAMLCALSPEERPAYVAALAQRLRPGGIYLGIPFFQVTNPKIGQPPFALDTHSLLSLFAESFNLLSLETRRDGHTDDVIQAEQLVIFQRHRF